jgi:hypothetical protein
MIRVYRNPRLFFAAQARTYHRPSPPPLPKDDQEILRAQIERASRPLAASNSASESPQKTIPKGDELHPDARRPLPAEFSGDVNPMTGEQGGPKREPLTHGDWTYGGRATDF